LEEKLRVLVEHVIVKCIGFVSIPMRTHRDRGKFS
jgi:hypothetical protein